LFYERSHMFRPTSGHLQATVQPYKEVQWPRHSVESASDRNVISALFIALSLTSARDGGGWSTPRPGRFTPGKDPVSIVQYNGVGHSVQYNSVGHSRSV
jgi:hypothetical protein